MRAIKILLFLSLLCFGGYKAIGLYTGNFSLEAILNHEDIKSEVVTTPSSEVQTLLNQPFHYLARGHQTFAFISEDGRFVVKFFNFSHLEEPFWVNFLQDFPYIRDYKMQKMLSKKSRLGRIFDGHEIAGDHYPSNYGIKYLHLGESNGLFVQPLKVYDRLGMKHLIPLDDVVFVLQDKAVIAREMFARLLAADDVEGVKQRIDQLFDLYRSEYSQGIYDKDPNVIDNVGFLGDKAVRIDVGRLRFGTTEKVKAVLHEKISNRIHAWMNKYFPGHYRELSQYADEQLSKL